MTNAKPTTAYEKLNWPLWVVCASLRHGSESLEPDEELSSEKMNMPSEFVHELQHKG